MTAGSANTTRFMMASATLMLGPMSATFDMLPATHSIGLVKNFTVTGEPSFVNLQQGSKNTTVFSAMIGNSVKCSAEVFEYTAANLAYGVALDGSTFAVKTASKVLSAPIVSGDTVVLVTSTSSISAGDYVMFRDTTSEDLVLVRKVVSISSGVSITVDKPILSAWAVATTAIDEVNEIPLGSTQTPAFLALKATGQLVDGTPISIHFGKVRIVKGFSLAFNSEQFGNMPFEVECLDLVPTDTHYSSFTNKKGGVYLT